MIQTIEVSNFQSLHDVALEVSPFTVVVGQSSSGKSALIRAIRLLAQNRRGLDFVSHGEQVTTVTAQTEAGSVTISRGKAVADNYYRLSRAGQDPLTFTKLNANVPEEVSQFLGIEPSSPLNFAGQHDKPFMLDDSGSSNAAALGRLTNVDVIFSAARESNRQKLDVSKTLKVRVQDLDQIKIKAKSYAPLKAQQAALSEAEEALAAAYSASRDLERIESAWTGYQVAAGALQRLEALAAVEVPSEQPVFNARVSLQEFTKAQRVLTEAVGAHRAAQSRAEAIQQDIDKVQSSYRDLLATMSLRLAEHMTEEGTVEDEKILVTEAAQLSTDYIVGMLS